MSADVFVIGFLKLKYLKHFNKCCEMNWEIKKNKKYSYLIYTYLSIEAETEYELLQIGGSPSSD